MRFSCGVHRLYLATSISRSTMAEDTNGTGGEGDLGKFKENLFEPRDPPHSNTGYWAYLGFLVILGLCALAINGGAAMLEALRDREANAVVRGLYEPWNAAYKRAGDAIRQWDAQAANNSMSAEAGVADLKNRVRPLYAEALAIAERFESPSERTEPIRQIFVEMSQRSLDHIDDLIDGIQRADIAFLQQRSREYEAYVKSMPPKMEAVLKSIGAKP